MLGLLLMAATLWWLYTIARTQGFHWKTFLATMAGLQHIPFKGNAIDGAFYRLDEMLRREKLMK